MSANIVILSGPSEPSWQADERVLLPVVDLAAGDRILAELDARAIRANGLVGRITWRLHRDGSLPEAARMPAAERATLERRLTVARTWYRSAADGAAVARRVLDAVRGA